MRKEIPKIRFVASVSVFNIFIRELNENCTDPDPYIAKGAEKLCDKISKYARFFTDENGNECVDIRFYESEAELIIWQYMATWEKLTNEHTETLDKCAETLEKHINTLKKCETYIEYCLLYDKALLIASRTLADYFYLPGQDDNESERIRTTRWYDQLLEQAASERVCRVCGCTEGNACGDGCYWVEDDLCSSCADMELEEPKDISQEVLRLHALGMAADAIAVHLGVDVQTVQWVLVQAGEEKP